MASNTSTRFVGVTPLPKIQLAIVFLIQLTEPMAATVIYPFIRQFVDSTGITGGNEDKTGYFAGIIESTFFLFECLTVLLWGLASDRFGRKPILLLGPLGLSVASLGFGLSTKYRGLVIWRSVMGMCNGGIGVSKTVLAELSDATNMAQVFSLAPMIWSVGVIIGPSVGGLLANPATQYPDTLGRIALLRAHPYFAPCAVIAMLAIGVVSLGVIGLRETHPAYAYESIGKSNRICGFKFGSSSEGDKTSRDSDPLVESESETDFGTRTGTEERPDFDDVLGEHTQTRRKVPRVKVKNYGAIPFRRERNPSGNGASSSSTTPTASRASSIRSYNSTSSDSDTDVESQYGPSRLKLKTSSSSLDSQASSSSSFADSVRPAFLPICSYALLAFLEASYTALVPVTLTAPLSAAGLGLSPAHLGLLLSCVGLINAPWAMFGVPRLIAKNTWGLGGVARVGAGAFVIGFGGIAGLIYLAGMLATAGVGVNMSGDARALAGGWGFAVVWILLPVQFLACNALMSMAFSTAQIIVITSATMSPSGNTSLGTVNGVCQAAKTLARTIGPVMATSLWSLSLQLSESSSTPSGTGSKLLRLLGMGGYMVYVLYMGLALLCLWTTRKTTMTLQKRASLYQTPEVDSL